MKKHFRRSKRFFVAVISMLLIFNQLSVLTPDFAYGLDLETEISVSSSEDGNIEETEAQGQPAESEAETEEMDETDIDSAEEETEIEAKGSAQRKNVNETVLSGEESLAESMGESADPEEISAAEDENEEVQVERGPPAEVQADTEEETGGTRAAKTATVLTFTSDIHNASDNTAANRLNTWLGKVIDMYGGIDLMSFCGDMGSASAGESEFWSYTRSVMDVVEGKNIPGVYTTGNHEFFNGQFGSTNNVLKQTYIVGEEALNEANYRIYCLGTDNWNNSSDNYTDGQITALANYLNSVGSEKPIIILTHFPLHYFSSGGGGGWGWGGGGGRQTTNADRVIDTLNDAANSGKTIIFLWGHNHTVSDTHYDEMYEPGSTIEYRSGSTKTFNFYYGAAGCMSDSEYGDGSAFVKGKGLVIAIDNDQNITFAYYDANGNNVTEAGSGGDTPSGPGGDDTETGEGVTPESGKKYVILASDGYALTSEGDAIGYTNGSSGSEQYNYMGLTGEEYTVGDSVAPDRLMWTFTASDDGSGFYIQSQDGRYLNGTYETNDTGGYDGTLKLDNTPDIWIITGTSSGSTVNAHILKSTNASQSDAGDKYLTHGNGDSSVANIFTLRSESNATSTIFYEYTDDGTFVEPDPDNPIPTGTIRYEETDHFEAGKEYIVAVTKDDSSVYAMSKTSSSVSAATLDVTAASGDTPAYITTNNSNVLWTYDSSGYLKNGSDYFYPTSNNGIMTYTSGRVISYADGKLSYETSSSGTYYITFSDGSFGTSNSEAAAASIRLFVKTQGPAPDDPDDPTPTEGTLYKLVDSFTSGQEYLIVSSDSAGSAYALTNPGGSSSGADMGSTTVTIQTGDVDADGTSDIYISAEASDLVWKAAANGDGFHLTNGSDSLEGKSGNVRIYSSVQYADRYWTYTDNQLKHVGGQNSYTVYYSNGFTSSYSSSSEKIFIYQKIEGGSVIPDDPTPTEGDIYKLTDKFVSGNEYLIVSSDAAGSAYALTNPGGTSGGAGMERTPVTVLSGDIDEDGASDIYVSAEAADIIWKAAANGDGFNLTNGSDSLEGKSGDVKIYNSVQYADRYWTYTDSQLQHVGGQNTYTVYYDSGFKATYDSNSNKIFIYEKVKDGSDIPDDPPIPADGTIYKLVNKFTSGKEYLIVSSDSEGSAYTLTNPGGTSGGARMERTAVTIVNGDADEDGTTEMYIASDATDIVWKAAANGDGFNLTNGSDSLEGKSGDVKIYNSVQYADRYWTYADSQLKHVGGQNSYTVYYDGGFKATYNSSSEKIYIYQKAESGPHEHSWDEGVITQEPDCTEPGVKTYTCAECGETKTEEIPPLGHSLIHHDAAAATCAAEGNIEYWTCERCGKFFGDAEGTAEITEADTVIAKTNEHSWDDGTVTTEATCTEPGEKLYTCTVCGETKTEVIPALGHEWKFQSFAWHQSEGAVSVIITYECVHDPLHQISKSASIETEETRPTCTEPGSIIYTATISEEEAPDGIYRQYVREQSVPALGHAFGEPEWNWDGFTAATATFTCSNDDTHIETAEAEITSAQGTGEDEGYTIYTASVVFEGKTYTDTKKEINPEAVTYELDQTYIEKLAVDSTEQLTLVGSDGSTGEGVWTSSDETIATVDQNGLVTAVRYGKATIHVEMEDGYEADCIVQTRFRDVAGSPTSGEPDYQYFFNAVYWAADHSPKAITRGYDLKYFGVGEACQRQDFILFIYRLAGEPAVSSSEINEVTRTFTDVSGLSNTFKKAIAWGSKQGIIKGYTSGLNAGKFGNGLEITRKEAMIMLYRYAGKPAPSAKGLNLVKTFTDVEGKVKATTDTYKAIAWAAGKGITNGYTTQDDTLTQHGYTVPCFGLDLPCMREQMIVFLYRSATK